MVRALVAAVVWVTGCLQTEGAGRRAWLRTTLVDDNRDVLDREPELTAGKFRVMAGRPYDFMRGSLGVFLRDAARPDARPTAHGSAAASRVLVLGDPHPENLGSFRRGDGRFVLEFNDFDGATFGPYHLDVRRLAVGFWLAAARAGLDVEAREVIARAAASGYVAEIDRLARGLVPLRVRPRAGFGRIVDDPLDRAEQEGDARALLDTYTRVASGRHVLRFGEIEPSLTSGVIEDTVQRLDDDEGRLLHAALASYPQTLIGSPPPPAFFRLKDAGRRLGAGVASYPRLRFYALIEGPSPSLDDDVLLEIKEVASPAHYPGYDLSASRPVGDDGERAVRAQRALHEVADADPLLGWARVAPLAFRVRQRTRYQRGISVDRIAEKIAAGTWTVEDLAQLALVAGRLLARGHALAPTATGERGLGALRAALGLSPAGFVEETLGVARDCGARVLDDHATFVALLDEEGPWLGYTASR